MKKTTIWLAKTAMMIALLLVLQFITSSLGQYVTGSCVNFILAMSVFIGDFASGIVVALLSPIFAFLLGIGPAFILISPCVSAGNFAFVVVMTLLWAKYVNEESHFIKPILAVLVGAVAKFLVLYFLVVKIVLPSLGLPEKQVAVMCAMFSYPQLVTAIIGGIIATIVASRIVGSVIKEWHNEEK